MSTDMMDHFATKHPNSQAFKCRYCENEAAVHISREQLKAHIQSWHPHQKLAHNMVRINLKKEDNSLIMTYQEEKKN